MALSQPMTSAKKPSVQSALHYDKAKLQALKARIAVVAEREMLTVKIPFTGAVLDTLPNCTSEDIQEAVKKARAAQASWKAHSFAERAKFFIRLHDLLFDTKDEVLDLIQLENGKSRHHAMEEIIDGAIVSRYYAHNAARHLKPRHRQGTLPFLTQTWEHHLPKGVVGIISPWNYPLALAISDAIPALMAGNAVILKPDVQTSFTALWVAELFERAGLPGDLFQIVTGDGRVVGPLLIDAVDFVTFTGSTATGRIVAQQCAKRLIGCALELGGKNAMLILPDANLERAVQSAVQGAFSSAGQLCVSFERLYIHESVFDEFVKRFVTATKNLKLGNTFDFSYDIGTLTSHQQLGRVTAHVQDAVARGATVLAGGKPRPDLGPYFFEPTILSQVTPEMKLFAEETFGPVIVVYPFTTNEEAVEMANRSVYGLNSSIWTKDLNLARQLANQIEAGTVNINEAYAPAWSSVDAPMGGFKDSGLGRRHGREGILKYTESQTVSAQHTFLLTKIPGFNDAQYSRLAGYIFKLLRRIPGIR
jgi:succinate-semialdehyde dehydrogenase / glutarate-semialdehyde dehydrogenase